MKTGKLIKELRTIKGMTQEELAIKSEVSLITIQLIENGELAPQAYTLQMIAEAFEVDFSIFTENEPEVDLESEDENKRTWLAVLHFSGILPLFFPAKMIYHRKKAEIKGMTKHYHAVIAFQSTILFFLVLGFWGAYKSGGPGPILGFLFLSVLFSIWNALKVLNGKPYTYFGIFKKKNHRTGLTS